MNHCNLAFGNNEVTGLCGTENRDPERGLNESPVMINGAGQLDFTMWNGRRVIVLQNILYL
jgi:hypothetical protein